MTQRSVRGLTLDDRTSRGMVEAMCEGAATVSSGGTILYANPWLATMLDRPVTELVGTEAIELTGASGRDALAQLLAVAAGESARGDVALTAAGGKTVPVTLVVSGFILDGTLLRGLVMSDLTTSLATEHALAEAHEALRTTEEQFRTLFEYAPVGIAHVGFTGELVRVNPRLCEMTGYSADELRGHHVEDLVHPADRPALRDNVARLLSGEIDRSRTEHRYLHKAGAIVWVESSGAVVRDSRGLPSMFVRVDRDITAVRQASAYARSLIEASLDPIVAISPDGTITDVNGAMTLVTGVAREELIGADFAASFAEPAMARAGYREAFEAGSVTDFAVTIEGRDGRRTPVLLNASLYRDPDGEVLGVFAAARDVTAQRQAEAAVAALNSELEARVDQRTAELERANQGLEAFAYSVSHDLRAPLRALSGFSEALLEEYGDQLDETGRGYAERIEAASDRMAKLIDELLHLSRISQAQIHLEVVDLSAEAVSIAADLQQRDPGRCVRFVIQDGIEATADRVLIRTVLENLLGNAWKFTAARDEAVIQFGTTPVAGASICCYVRDNGAGFDAAYVDKLFQAFQRLHSTREFPGNGVGLVSVRRVVERHGGRTWAEGAIDNGATFFFTLEARDES